MARLKIILVNIFFPVLLFSQAPKTHNYAKPIDLPFYLSGTFGELRPNHFHTGIDIKTKGKTGFKIKSIEEGYISRISISPFGYGKAIYIDHPDGVTSVYAHLDKFSSEIEKLVKEQQYEQKKFRINIFPKKGEIKVKKNQDIGYSGNSGSSQGPHLHFEIRESSSQKPLNPLIFDYKAPDDKQPSIKNIVLYKFPNKEASSIYVEKEIITLKSNTEKLGELNVENGFLAFGVYSIDYLNNSWSRNGIYKVELFLKDDLISKIEMDTLSFSEQKYLNASIDYSLYKSERKRIQKLFRDPGNLVSIYKVLENDGYVKIERDSIYNFEIVVEDFKGNKSSTKFSVKGSDQKALVHEKNNILMKYDEQNTIQTNNFKFTLDKKSLYSDIYFNYSENEDYIEIGNEELALLKAYKLELKVDSTFSQFLDKLSIVNIDDKGNKSYLGGSLIDDKFVLKSKTFGKLKLDVDTIPPTVEPINTFEGRWMSKEKYLTISISDKETGIKDYTAQIDGNWILMEYDAKNDLLIYDFSDIDLKGKKHKFTIEVKDNVDNTSKLEFNFYK